MSTWQHNKKEDIWTLLDDTKPLGDKPMMTFHVRVKEGAYEVVNTTVPALGIYLFVGISFKMEEAFERAEKAHTDYMWSKD